jgi:hypothetical protein
MEKYLYVVFFHVEMEKYLYVVFFHVEMEENDVQVVSLVSLVEMASPNPGPGPGPGG